MWSMPGGAEWSRLPSPASVTIRTASASGSGSALDEPQSRYCAHCWAKDAPPGSAGRTMAWAREKEECRTACAATVADMTRANPRSFSARHHPVPPVARAPAVRAHQGTEVPDISACPMTASSTQTAANIAARIVRQYPPAVMAGSSLHPRLGLHPRVRKLSDALRRSARCEPAHINGPEPAERSGRLLRELRRRTQYDGDGTRGQGWRLLVGAWEGPRTFRAGGRRPAP